MASRKRRQNFENGHEGNGNLRKKQCSESPTPKVGGQEDSLSSKDKTALESNSQVNTDQSDIQSNNDQSNNQEKNDGGEKMRVKWFMAIIIFAHFCFKVFAYGNHHVQTVQYVMLLNLIIVAYRFQLGKSKNDRAEHEGRVRTVFAANCICILYFTCVSTLQRFGICLHNPSEVSCVRDIYNGFLGEAADIANLVPFLFPTSFIILRLVFAILNSWKIEKIGYIFLFLCFNKMLSVYDLRVRDKPILTKGSMLLFFTFFCYLLHILYSVLEYQSQQSSSIGRWITQKWQACTTYIKKWNWIPNSAFRAAELLFDFYVLHPLGLLLGAEKARVFLGLPKTDSAPIKEINYVECIDFGVVHVVAVTCYDGATIPLLCIFTLWPLVDLRFKLSTATILVLFGIISFIYRENFIFNFVLAFVIHITFIFFSRIKSALYTCIGYKQDQTEKTEAIAAADSDANAAAANKAQADAEAEAAAANTAQTDAEARAAAGPEAEAAAAEAEANAEAELKESVRSIGFTVHFITIAFFLATWFILLLSYFLVLVNSVAAIVVSGDNDDWFLWSMKRLSFYALFMMSVPFLKLAFGVVLDANGGFKKLFTSVDHFFTNRSDDQQKKNPQTLLILFLLTLILSRVFAKSSIGGSTLRGNYSSDESGLSMSMFDLRLRRNDTTHEHVRVQRSANHSYSSCSLRWGENLTPLDHAILARMAYFQATNDDLPEELTGMQKALKFAFPDTTYNVTLDVDWKGEGVHPMRTGAQDKKDVFTKYYKFDFHNLKHTVIAVQGTDGSDNADILADARLILPSILVDFAERFIPSLNFFLPRHRTYMQRIINQMQAWFTLDAEELNAYVPIVRYVHELLNNKTRRDYVTDSEDCSGDECWTMSVTGHSLGGCLALIVGTTLEIPSVTFSGPGLMFGKGQYETDVGGGEILSPKLASAARISTAFIPSSDLVPRFDTHFGHTQDMVCPRSNGYITCHFLSDNICDLLLRCGDNQNQTRFHSCKASMPRVFDKHKLEEYISGF